MRMPRSEAPHCRASEAMSPGPSPMARNRSNSIAPRNAALRFDGSCLALCLALCLVRHVELISDARLSQDVTRLGGLRFDLLAELIDKHPQIDDLVAVVRSPHRLQQPAMRNGSIGTGRQILQKVELLAGQTDFVAPHIDPARGEVDLQAIGLQQLWRRFRSQRRAAQPGADTRQ